MHPDEPPTPTTSQAGSSCKVFGTVHMPGSVLMLHASQDCDVYRDARMADRAPAKRWHVV